MAKRRMKTISLPPDVDEELDRFPKENWSRTACKAFRVRLLELKAMNKTGKEAALARLRASRERAINKLFAAGEIAGTHFAMDVGEYDELERLQRYHDSNPIEWNQIIEQTNARDLAQIMAGDTDDSSRIEEWFRQNHGADSCDSSWVEGFVHGALSMFEELQQEIKRSAS